MDDDVDTDDDIISSAKSTCRRDLTDAILRIDKEGIERIVHNIGIENRCKQPKLYDRNGQLRQVN